MDNNEESLRKKFLSQHPNPNANLTQPKKSPVGQPTFDQKFRGFTAKVDDRLKDIAIAIIFGGIIGWIFLLAIGNLLSLGNNWILDILVLTASCGLIYWYLRRSES